jgi:hypothetical protein
MPPRAKKRQKVGHELASEPDPSRQPKRARVDPSESDAKDAAFSATDEQASAAPPDSTADAPVDAPELDVADGHQNAPVDAPAAPSVSVSVSIAESSPPPTTSPLVSRQAVARGPDSRDSKLGQDSKNERKTEDAEEKEKRLPKRKVALLVGYCGLGYSGSQMCVTSCVGFMHSKMCMLKEMMQQSWCGDHRGWHI